MNSSSFTDFFQNSLKTTSSFFEEAAQFASKQAENLPENTAQILTKSVDLTGRAILAISAIEVGSAALEKTLSSFEGSLDVVGHLLDKDISKAAKSAGVATKDALTAGSMAFVSGTLAYCAYDMNTVINGMRTTFNDFTASEIVEEPVT